MAFRKNHAGTPAVVKTNLNIPSGSERINELISAEQKKMEQQYLQIGKLYAASHLTDFEEKYAGMMSAIQVSEKKLGTYRTQKQLLKGVACCPVCGNEAPSGSAFCNRCGAKIPPMDMSQFIKCPSCGKSVVKDLGDCVFCGSSLTETDSLLKCAKCGEPLEAGARFCRSCGSAVKKAEIPEADAPSKRVCPSCGAALADDVLFCTECGQKL